MPKEDPTNEATPNPVLNISKAKVKKTKRKKKQMNRSESSVSSSSVSEVGVLPQLPDNSPLQLQPQELAIADAREEFYDAHESYHALSDPVITSTLTSGPAAPGALLLAPSSEHGPTPKVTPGSAIGQGRSAGAAVKKPSAINKPVTRPE